MARLVEVRKTYQADALYLQRLIKAIEIDPRRTPAWKQQATNHLREVTSMLFQTLVEKDK